MTSVPFTSAPSVSFFNRDLSWLSFNERVLMEAENPTVPLLERLKFLAIYSSNLDEFYRVRITSVLAAIQLGDSSGQLDSVKAVINEHMHRYGHTLINDILPALRNENVEFLYNQLIPEFLNEELKAFFYNTVAGLLHIREVSKRKKFVPENNKLFFTFMKENSEKLFVVNIPSDVISRFYSISKNGKTYILMLDDIVRKYLPTAIKTSCEFYSFKVTRDAELSLQGEVSGSITHRMEKLLAKREYGFATRLLFDEATSERIINKLADILQVRSTARIPGGRYHNLKDLFSFPYKNAGLFYSAQPPIEIDLQGARSIFSRIDDGDIMVHTPYQSYNLIIRFFNEAAIDPCVESIYVTLYRVAVDSSIAQALMSAAQNGKKVTVMVELKARFDESNNIRWAKKLKAAGVTIIYSRPELKVHAKVALVKRRESKHIKWYGVFSTGNFNESTARLYTDHILLTGNSDMLSEARSVFKMLQAGNKISKQVRKFNHLIVAPVNIRQKFFALIDREISNHKEGKNSGITIKLNNLEEETLINKLYEASAAGVKINLIVRSICRLIPGVAGLSENITVHRIVDRYLEHGRIFIFTNDTQPEVYCGSADWMNRNIYHRIEVCFPVYDAGIRSKLIEIITIQLSDNIQAVNIDSELSNNRIPVQSDSVRSQEVLYNLFA